MTTITCKICEKQTSCDLLADHSSICKEVTLLRESLSRLRSIMEAHAEKAITMKNSLETFAVKQKKKYKKRFSRCSSNEDLSLKLKKNLLRGYSECNSPENSTFKPKKNVFTPDLRLHQNLLLSTSSEKQIDSEGTTDIQETQSYISQENSEIQDESPGLAETKMSQEEYEKFKEQVRKSTFALRRIIAYGDRINEWAFEVVSINDLEMNFKHELEVLYGEINDTKVSEFIKMFMEDFSKYITMKTQFMKKKEELEKIDCKDDEEKPKIRPRANKSLSFKLKTLNGIKTLQVNQKFKEDDAFGLPTPEPEHVVQKRNSIQKSPSDVAAYFMGKRNTKPLQLRQNTEVSSEMSSNRSGEGPSPSKRLGSENRLSLLRASLNINPVIVSNGSRKLIKETKKSSMFLKKLNGGKEGSVVENDISSPEEKEVVKEMRKSSPLFDAKKLHKVGSNEKEKEAGSIKEKKKKNLRSNSISLLKAMRNEDGLIKGKFPSLTNLDDFQPLVSREKKKESYTRQRSSPERALCESPIAKGYHSDINYKSKRKCSYGESTEVSIKDFEFIKFLGKGAFGIVWLVKKKATGDLYAMKTVDWADRMTHNRIDDLKAEKDIYEVIQGDYVVKAIWTFHYNNFICFVTEYMIGGDFNKLLEDEGRLDEEQARFYCAELVLAIESLHNLGIVHRDLKPENILIDNKGHIRLTDFGLSDRGINKLRHSTPNNRKNSNTSPDLKIQDSAVPQKMQVFSQMCKEGVPTRQSEQHNQKVKFHTKTTTKIFDCLDYVDDNHGIHKKVKFFERAKKTEAASSPLRRRSNNKVGTPDYMAPELINPEKFIKEPANEKCIDWWSMGVILYQFLVGIPPFCGETIEEVFSNIENLKIEWPAIGYEEDCISPEAQSLIQGLLNPDSNKRLGAHGTEEIKSHPFFKAHNFNWEDPKSWEPPLVPYIPTESEINKPTNTNQGAKVKEKFQQIFDEPVGGRKVAKSRTVDFVDLGGFQMRRLDVLHKLNQEAFLHHQIQKSKTLGHVSECRTVDSVDSEDR